MNLEFTNNIEMTCKIYLSNFSSRKHYAYAKIVNVDILNDTYIVNYNKHKLKYNRQVLTLEYVDIEADLRSVDKCIYPYKTKGVNAPVEYKFINTPINEKYS